MYPTFWEKLDIVGSALRLNRSKTMELMILIGTEEITKYKDKKALRDYFESKFLNMIATLENEGRIIPLLEAKT